MLFIFSITHTHSSLPFPSLHIPSPHSTHICLFHPPPPIFLHTHPLSSHTWTTPPPPPPPHTHTPHVHPSTNSPFRLMDKYTNTPHTPSSQIYKCIMHPYGLNRERVCVCVCACACVCACVHVCMHVLNKQPFPMMHPNHSHWRHACTEQTSMALHNLKRSKCWRTLLCWGSQDEMQTCEQQLLDWDFCGSSVLPPIVLDTSRLGSASSGQFAPTQPTPQIMHEKMKLDFFKPQRASTHTFPPPAHSHRHIPIPPQHTLLSPTPTNTGPLLHFKT